MIFFTAGFIPYGTFAFPAGAQNCSEKQKGVDQTNQLPSGYRSGAVRTRIAKLNTTKSRWKAS
jgi:hypothetical protein